MPSPAFFHGPSRPRLRALVPAPGLGPAFGPVLCLACLLAWLLAWPGAFALAADSPLQALTVAQQGIDECDSDKFNRVVDVNQVVSKASDDLIAALGQMAQDGELEGSLGMALAMVGSDPQSPQMALIKPLLISEMRGFVATGINGGYFAGQPDNSVRPPRGSLASTLEKMPVGRRQIVPGRVLSSQEGKALVSATFIDPKAGEFALKLLLEQEGGAWRVKEIANAPDLVKEAVKRDR